MSQSKNLRITFGRWLVRSMAILVSTIAAIDLLKQEYREGLILVLAWVFIISAERRMKSLSGDSDKDGSQ